MFFWTGPGRALDLLSLTFPWRTYWKVSRSRSRSPAGLITYQKTFPGRSGLIGKFPVPARGARPDLLLIRKLSLAVLDLLESFQARLAGPSRTYYLSENFFWPYWTYWKVSRPGSRGPAGLITYQKTFLGPSGLIEKFPEWSPKGRPGLIIKTFISEYPVDLLSRLSFYSVNLLSRFSIYSVDCRFTQSIYWVNLLSQSIYSVNCENSLSRLSLVVNSYWVWTVLLSQFTQ